MKTLVLKRMGIDFSGNNFVEGSDIGNFRVRADIENIGILDFMNGVDTIYTGKNGKPLKNPRIVSSNKLVCDGCTREQYKKLSGLKYTKADILKFVNMISDIQYDNVDIMDNLV